MIFSPRISAVSPIIEFLQPLGQMPRPVHCSSIGTALSEIRSGEFDIVVVDLIGAATDSLRVIECLRADPWLQDAACLALVSGFDDQAARRAIALGVDDLLRDPTDLEFLAWRATRSLEHRRLRNEALNYWTVNSVGDLVDQAASALDALPAPVLVLGPNATVELANEAAGRLFGLPSASLIGTQIGALLSRSGDAHGEVMNARSIVDAPPATLFDARRADGSVFGVRISTAGYERFGQRMWTCILSESGRAIGGAADQGTGTGVGPATVQIWREVADQALRRLDEAERHVAIMRDQIFGPIGTAIYRSYLTDALSSLMQVRQLLDRNSGRSAERRSSACSSLFLSELAREAVGVCGPRAAARNVAFYMEIVPPDMQLRLPSDRISDLLCALLTFAAEAADTGDAVALRAQIASDQRLLLMVDAGGTAVSTAHLAPLCVQEPMPGPIDLPLALAWKEAGAAARALGGVLELNLDHPRGGFIAMAFLPRRREDDFS